jgi:alpha-N-arabinofuranosidase
VETEGGDWFAVFLGVRPNGYPPCYHLGRETFLAPVTWAADGFPVIGDEGRIAPEMEAKISPEPFPPPRQRDDFRSGMLAPHWNHLRNPDPTHYSLTEKPDHLRLWGSATNLEEVASPTWVGRRQCHFNVRAMASLEFHPGTEREEAGLTVRMNERHHYEIFVTQRGGKPSLVLRRRIGNLQAEVAHEPIPPSEAHRLVLAIDAEKDKYTFLHGASEDHLKPLGEGETRYLSTEVAGGFTGVYLAMYATGNGAPCSQPADFDWFDYSERP